MDEYNELRSSVGWFAINPEQAEAGLMNSAYIVVSKDSKEAVGMSKLIWDGGSLAIIVDVIVRPTYQRMGIGTKMIEQLLEYLKGQMKLGWSIVVDLMSASGKEEFYRKFGFRFRPREGRGAGMDMWILEDKNL